MSDNFSALEQWAGALLSKLSPAARRQLATTIARDLRRSQQQRIASQKNPDGSAYEPRKARKLRGKKGQIRNAMFLKIRNAKNLKARGDANSAVVGFMGRTAYIARIHQEGLAGRVDKKGPIVKYPARVLLGITDEERDNIKDLLLKHLVP